MRKLLSLSLLSLSVVACAQNPAGDKDGDLESTLLNESVGDTDSSEDGFTRRVSIEGTLGYGETIEASYGEGAYSGWLFTAEAGARITLDATALDWSDTVLMVYGPQTGRGWSRARPIAVNDDYRGSTDSHIEFRAPRAGTYLVIVREYWGDSGLFQLTLGCSGSECRLECGADDRCPAGSSCHRIVCIRAPCPSFCEAIDPTPAPEPGDACEESLCGVRPRTVTLMCADGSLGGNTGRCLYNDDLSCGWEMRACPDVACGARLGDTCGEDQFCDFSEAAMCGYADGTGVCAPRPEVCTAHVDPVCGCNGVTYSNACMAQSARVDVLHSGACDGEPTEVACGARLGDTCGADEFCDFSESAMCGYADGTGVCAPRPEVCTALYDPVCGCDGRTYSNACSAMSHRVDVLHDGECGSDR